MDYVFVLTTHGDAPHLNETIDSFARMVTPAPAHAIAILDGEDAREPMFPPSWSYEFWTLPKPQGFAEVLRRATLAAASARQEWVLHCENDFRFDRPVDLNDLAVALVQNGELAQMSLLRGPANKQEEAAGGVARLHGFEQHPGGTFMVQDAYWTTNPHLTSRQVLAENAWPTSDRSEGKFTIRLREKGYRFGVWGGGEPWITHLGERTGFGY